ncbi:hypothetical protein H4S02_001836 [Coemansia sp. RSA 2611]|nr:hypothetical protein IWW54_004725 [Coemansia sp. RSA 2705]KAJ2323852.1 hypothetical protein IWW51_003558 [Coemansia sp. RSA 2702]KAJ2361950.1 hypothetical protein H4S01_005026 [Coemansia sp. RSA 2610]KAJ2390484.1 hypothetical protein H4S02_001836 [Coemansia sp. RSA 2611]KAJ2737829.1 hypothetical protein H4R23_001569 [Coemansia sp. Cherry 401B]
MQAYIDGALQFAFPALVVSAVVYVAAAAVSGRLARRRAERRQAAEDAHRRQVYADRYKAGASEPAPQPNASDDAPLVRPRAPAPTDRPFGSGFMTMSDLRSRISRPSSGCVVGSCCG